jgi:hypothetical protein
VLTKLLGDNNINPKPSNENFILDSEKITSMQKKND